MDDYDSRGEAGGPAVDPATLTALIDQVQRERLHGTRVWTGEAPGRTRTYPLTLEATPDGYAVIVTLSTGDRIKDTYWNVVEACAAVLGFEVNALTAQQLDWPAIEAALPALYSQEQTPDPLVVVKFFTPDTSWTWYATEGSPVDADGYYDTDAEKVDFLFFGLVVGQETELGYFSLSELQAARGPLGLPIEQDRHFTPTRLSIVRASERS